MQIDVAQQAAQHGAADEAQAEGGADLAETLGAVVRRGHIGGIRGCHRHAGRRHAANHPAYEQAGQVGRQRGGEDHGLLACFPAGATIPEGFVALGSCSAQERSASRILCDGYELQNYGWEHYRA